MPPQQPSNTSNLLSSIFATRSKPRGVLQNTQPVQPFAQVPTSPFPRSPLLGLIPAAQAASNFFANRQALQEEEREREIQGLFEGIAFIQAAGGGPEQVTQFLSTKRATLRAMHPNVPPEAFNAMFPLPQQAAGGAAPGVTTGPQPEGAPAPQAAPQPAFGPSERTRAVEKTAVSQAELKGLQAETQKGFLEGTKVLTDAIAVGLGAPLAEVGTKETKELEAQRFKGQAAVSIATSGIVPSRLDPSIRAPLMAQMLKVVTGEAEFEDIEADLLQHLGEIPTDLMKNINAIIKEQAATGKPMSFDEVADLLLHPGKDLDIYESQLALYVNTLQKGAVTPDHLDGLYARILDVNKAIEDISKGLQAANFAFLGKPLDTLRYADLLEAAAGDDVIAKAAADPIINLLSKVNITEGDAPLLMGEVAELALSRYQTILRNLQSLRPLYESAVLGNLSAQGPLLDSLRGSLGIAPEGTLTDEEAAAFRKELGL